MGYVLTSEDLKQIESRGVQPSAVIQQLKNYQQGFPRVQLVAAATTRKGIVQMTEKRMNDNIRLYQEYVNTHKVIKFVPASGAASRMFKHLFEFRNNYRGTNEDQLEMLKDKGPDSVYYFFEHIEEFPFIEELISDLEKRGYDLETVLKESRYERILTSLLTEKGLNYSQLPKALIPFHRYKDQTRTSFMEHLIEAAMYGVSAGNRCYVHFTILQEHIKPMQKHLEKIRKDIEESFHTNLVVEFSIQDPATDMMAVDQDNQPVRDEKGEMLFRPGGHGSLIRNLENLDADLIIIKNIDNIATDRQKEGTVLYKQALAGKLIFLQDQVFSYLRGLDNPTLPSSKVVDQIWSFMERKLQVVPPEGSNRWKKEEKIEYLLAKLNRPIRVCGMVENEGEPGGGPFWVMEGDGTMSLQIIEAAQIDRTIPEQEEIVQASTHFNPVDIVCSTMNYKGVKFELSNYIDYNTGIISSKSIDGNEIKAQELPGLWNGSMADWITVFVEVPLATFTPVKTVNDLLRIEHTEQT